MKIIVKVIVNAKITKVVEDTTDLLGSRFLKIKVNKPPEDGKANKEVIKAISEYLKVKERNITIVIK